MEPAGHKVKVKTPHRGPIKQLLSFMWGFKLGIVFFYYVLKPLPIPLYSALIITFVISLLLGLGNAFSIQVRCISLLTIPLFCGRAGRGVLKAVILALIIAGEPINARSDKLTMLLFAYSNFTGPITNIYLNGKEVIRVFSCSASLSANLSQARYNLMMQPLRKALKGMKGSVPEVKETLRSFRDVAASLKQEIDSDDGVKEIEKENDYIDDKLGDPHRDDEIEEKYEVKKNDDEPAVIEKHYQKKMELRCQDELSKGAGSCMKSFAKAYDACYAKMPWYAGWILCWPMKLSFVCNVMFVVGGQRVCDSTKHVDPGLGEGYASFKKSKHELADKFSDVKLQFHVTGVSELYDIQSAQETSKLILNEIEEKDKIVQTIVLITKSLLTLMFIRVFMASQDYHDHYLSDIDYDNIYVTSYFRRIDQRRKRQNKYTLLPLKKMERRKLINLSSLSYVSFERNKLIGNILKLCLEVMTAVTFIMMDRLFYEALDVVRRHAKVDFTQQGRHDLEVIVKGTGMLAGLFRKILGGLNSKSRIQRTISNEHCLPKPKKLSRIFMVKIFGGYALMVVLIFMDAFTLRFRRLICGYFYPKREKQRVLHLYNDILKKRNKLKKTFRKRALRNARMAKSEHGAGDLLVLRLKFPFLFGWLRILPQARKSCVICEETEPLKPRHWYECPTCHSVYCPECWQEVGHACQVCDTTHLDSSDDDSISDLDPWSD